MILFKRDDYYHVEYFDQTLGKLRRKTLKTKNKNEALKKLTEFKKSLSQSNNKSVITLSVFEDKYVNFIQETGSKKYLRSVKLSFRMLRNNLKTDVRIIDLRRAIIERFLFSVFSKSKYAAHLYFRTLKAAMNKAIVWGYLAENPFKGIKLPKIATKHPVFITEKELKLITKNIREQNIKNIVAVAFYTGMRLSEILNLRYKAVNLSSGIIKVQNNDHFTTKNKHKRSIPIHNNLHSILINNEKAKMQRYVFSKNGVLYNADFVSKIFKKAVHDAGPPDEIHFHSLRHNFASNLVMKGVSLYVVKELLGHESITTTQIYSHLQNESLVKAISVL